MMAKSSGDAQASNCLVQLSHHVTSHAHGHGSARMLVVRYWSHRFRDLVDLQHCSTGSGCHSQTNTRLNRQRSCFWSPALCIRTSTGL